MKSHLTSSSTSLGNQEGMAEALPHPDAIGDRADRAQAVPALPRLTPVGAPVWRHKLILTGRLDCRTVVELEDEIECLCQEGVTVLTLDLRQLDAIDSVGASAIAFRGSAAKRRGPDVAVVPGSPVIRRALVEAGADSLLSGDPEPGVLPLATGVSDGSLGDRSTVMIKNL